MRNGAVSTTGNIEADIYLTDLVEAEFEFDFEEIKPNGKKAQQIRREAQYYAATKGGEVEDWIEELTGRLGKSSGGDKVAISIWLFFA
jgi:hypothetical protein